MCGNFFISKIVVLFLSRSVSTLSVSWSVVVLTLGLGASFGPEASLWPGAWREAGLSLGPGASLASGARWGFEVFVKVK